MINWDKIDQKISVKKIILPIFLVIIILLLFAYGRIIYKRVERNSFVKDMMRIADKNATPVFSIEKIYLCSSANAVDTTREQNLNNMDLYQYTDIAVYINNNKDNGLTNKNTVKELYIDNINLKLDSGSGNTGLVYTNLLNIGSKEQLKKILSSSPEIFANSRESKTEDIFSSNEIANIDDVYEEEIPNDYRIDFNIVSTNEENSEANYENPTFYADCSNPISLKYINKLNKTYSIGQGDSAVFDGSLLQKAGVTIEEINCKIKFKINLVSNDGDCYYAWLNFKLPLSDIYNGTSIKSKTTVGKYYDFFNSGI